jgi:transposase
MGMSTAAPHSEPMDTNNVPLPTPEQLPNDLDTLKRMIVELMVTLHEERRDKENLKHRLQLLLDRLYGPRTERSNPDQLLLFADWADAQDAAAASTVDSAEAPAAKSRQRKPKTPHGRGKLPEQLPRRQVHHQLCEAERICVCGQLRIDIGTDTSERVDWQPASLFVWQDIVHKYLCRACANKSAEGTMTTPAQAPPDKTTADAADTATPLPPGAARPIGPAVISASKPPAPIAKGLPGAGLLAYLIVSKYFDHLPLHRLEHILKRQGLPLSRSTMCDWMAVSAEALRPLYDTMVSQVLQSAWLHTDDTPVKNQGHEPGTTALSRFWIYWGDRTHPYNVFDFTINRKRDGPQTFLANFHGYLHADAFSGYDALYLPSPRGEAGRAAGRAAAPIIEVACNAHARRKFHEARGSDDLRAHQALAYYAQLYFLERGASDAGLNDIGRWRMRQDFSVSILEQFHGWLVEQRQQVLPKSPMAEAIGYALNNWTALSRFTEAGFLSIDNNVAEREMKRIAIGRKNWLFVGSDRGGRTAAILFSFTSTCHRLGVEPWAYLQDVLTRLPTTPAERLAELLPDRWQAAHPPAAPSAEPATDSASASRSPP